MKKTILGLSIFLTFSVLLQSFTFAACYKVEPGNGENLLPVSTYNPDGTRAMMLMDSQNMNSLSILFSGSSDYEISTGNILSCNDWLQQSTGSTRMFLYDNYYKEQLQQYFIKHNISSHQDKLAYLSKSVIAWKTKYANYNFKDGLTRKKIFPSNGGFFDIDKIPNISNFRIEVMGLGSALKTYEMLYSILIDFGVPGKN